MVSSFRELRHELHEGTKCKSFNSNSGNFFHFIIKESSSSTCYVCYDRQAEYVAVRCLGTTDALNTEAGVKALTLSESMMSRAVLSLLQLHICIKLWRKNTDENSSFHWILDSVATPGDITAVSRICSSLACISIAAITILCYHKNLKIGLSFFSVGVAIFELKQGDTSAQLMDLQGLLRQYKPRECMVFNRIERADLNREAGVDECDWMPQLAEVMRAYGIFSSCIDTGEIRKENSFVNDFGDDAVLSTIKKLCNLDDEGAGASARSLSSELLARPCGTGSLVRLLQRLNMWAAEAIFPMNLNISFPDRKGVLMCDDGTFHALCVFDHPLSEYCFEHSESQSFEEKIPAADSSAESFERTCVRSSQVTSLYAILNTCRTVSGSKTLRCWLRQPRTDAILIRSRHDVVQVLSSNQQARDQIQSNLTGLPDIDTVGWRLQSAPSRNRQPQQFLIDIMAAHHFVQRVASAASLMIQLSSELGTKAIESNSIKDFLSPIRNCLEQCAGFSQLVEATVDREVLNVKGCSNWTRCKADVSDLSLERTQSRNTATAIGDAERLHDMKIKSWPTIFSHIGGAMSNHSSDGEDNSYQRDINYNSFSKRSFIRIKPSLSSELLALDKAHRYALSELNRERLRINDCITGFLDQGVMRNATDSASHIPDDESLLKKRKCSSVDGSCPEIEVCPVKKAVVLIDRSGLHGYHLRITRKHQHMIYSALQDSSAAAMGVDIEIITSSGKNGLLFTTKQFSAMSCKCEIIGERYVMAEKDLILKLLGQVKQYLRPLRDLNKMVSELDCLLSFAEVSQQRRWTCPTMASLGSKCMRILNIRDPVAENRVGVTDYVPSDYNMNAAPNCCEYIDGAFILTGPNMGGKSTYIKAVGIVCLLAHIGCFVPASEAVIPLYDQIFTHQSHGDSIVNGTSCFMSDMVGISRILREATSQSLVLMDELGVGTSTLTGIGITVATIYRLAVEIKCTLLCTTHFSELKLFEAELTEAGADTHVPKTINCRFFHISRTCPGNISRLTYAVSPDLGECDQDEKNFALEVAAIAGVPTELLDDAARLMSGIEN